MQELRANSKLLIIKLVFIFVLTAIDSTVAIDDLEEVNNLETSIVLLKITAADKTIATNHFFEVLSLINSDTDEEYVLVPLNLISPYFEININFKRENNLIIVSNPQTSDEVQINLEKREYINHSEWSEKAPIVLGGDFFVSTEVLEYLYGVNVDWNSSYQELIITGDYFQAEEQISADEEKKDKAAKLEEKEQDIIFGPRYSLGSVQYQLELDYHRLESGSTEWITSNRFNVHGRWEDWALSMGVESRENFSEISLPLMRATYNQDNRLIIVGDSEFDFNNTLGEQNLRGVYYKKPDQQWNKNLSYISISGTAEDEATARLYVNDHNYKKIKIDSDQEYQFKNINLRNKRLNTLQVVIENKNGEEKEVIKKVVGSPKIYRAGTKEIDVVGGWYQKSGYNNWDGKMVGVKSSYALDGTTFNLESVVNEDFNYEGSPNLFASDLVFASRIGEQVVIDSNFLWGGELDSLEQGYTASALYCLEEGYIEGSYFYIPYPVYLRLPKGQGKGARVLTEWDLAKKWRVQSLLAKKYATINSNSDELQEGELSFLYQDSWRSSGQVTGRIERIIFTKDEDSRQLDRYGLVLGRSKVGNGFRSQGELAIFKNKLFLIDGGIVDYEDLNLEGEIYRKLTSTLLIINNLEAKSDVFDWDFYNTVLENDFKLKWSPRADTFLSGWQNLEVQGEADKLNRVNEEVGASITYYLDANNILNLDISDNESEDNLDYRLSSLRLTHFWPERKGQISVSLNQYSPSESGFETQNTFAIDAKRTLEEKQELELKVAKTYNGISTVKPEYFISLSLTHAFGFVGNELIPQEFNSNDHSSFVTGYVYLDENNNQIMDQEEEKLPGVRMVLENLMTKTNQNGQFQFNLTRPGTYALDFDFNSLVADYTPVTKEQVIKVRENENMIVNYGLTINGSITAKVFADNNANGKLDEGEKPLSWIGFSLNNGEKIAYTDKRGEFYLENVPLGAHQLTVIKDSLPELMIPQQGFNYKVKIIKEKLDIQELLIPVVYDFGE